MKQLRTIYDQNNVKADIHPFISSEKKKTNEDTICSSGKPLMISITETTPEDIRKQSLQTDKAISPTRFGYRKSVEFLKELGLREKGGKQKQPSFYGKTRRHLPSQI